MLSSFMNLNELTKLLNHLDVTKQEAKYMYIQGVLGQIKE
jgi:hypothetical protein